MKAKKRLYAIKSPAGVLMFGTASWNRAEAWTKAYDKHMRLGYLREGMTKTDYRKVFYRCGWRCVPVTIVEVEE